MSDTITIEGTFELELPNNPQGHLIEEMLNNIEEDTRLKVTKWGIKK